LLWRNNQGRLPVEETHLNIIISFAGLESSPNPTSYALRHIAGSTILGHILVHLLNLSFDQLILIVSSGEEEVHAWLQQNVPDLTWRTCLSANARDPLSALGSCKDVLDEGAVLFISGNYIAEAPFHDLISAEFDVSCLLQSEQDQIPAQELRIDAAGFVVPDADNTVRWAGSCWFRHGTNLKNALETAAETDQGIYALLTGLAAQGLPVATRRAVYCLDTRTAASMLYANARLLRLNHGSQDAIERSYAEDFTVIPPVFLHETAVIENAVIGPFVNLEAQAAVRNSVVSNSLIGVGAQVTDAVLDASIIGSHAAVSGQKSRLTVAENAVVIIGKAGI
jgi:glucose-1-phosphate thymidylyltransferase